MQICIQAKTYIHQKGQRVPKSFNNNTYLINIQQKLKVTFFFFNFLSFFEMFYCFFMFYLVEYLLNMFYCWKILVFFALSDGYTHARTHTHTHTHTHIYIYIYLIAIQSMKGWTATTKHEVTRKRSAKRFKYTENLFRKNPLLIVVC